MVYHKDLLSRSVAFWQCKTTVSPRMHLALVLFGFHTFSVLMIRRSVRQLRPGSLLIEKATAVGQGCFFKGISRSFGRRYPHAALISWALHGSWSCWRR